MSATSRTAVSTSQDLLRNLALLGAQVQLKELQENFPELFPAVTMRHAKTAGRPRAAVFNGNGNGTTAKRAAATRRRRRPTMTAQQRKAVSDRMRKYWAGRRAESVKVKKATARKAGKTNGKSKTAASTSATAPKA